MAKKYVIYMDEDGKIQVRSKFLFFKSKVLDQYNNYMGPYGSVQSAENAIEAVEQKRHEKRRSEQQAIADSGVKYTFDAASDDAFTIRNQFRVVRTNKDEETPFYLQELCLRGWLPVVYKYRLLKAGQPKKFSSLANAKAEILAIAQKLQEAKDLRKKARVLKVIDAKVFELSESNQIAKAT